MENKFYTSTNWAPWLGLGFLLSTIFFSSISETWLMIALVIFSFLPAFIVRLTLRGYYQMDNFLLRYAYDRKEGRKVSFSIPMMDIQSVKKAGKSLQITHTKNIVLNTRVHDAETFVGLLLKYNPRIKLEN
jgi:hypothetical protein